MRLKHGTRNRMHYSYELPRFTGKWLVVIPLLLLAIACIGISGCEANATIQYDMAGRL